MEWGGRLIYEDDLVHVNRQIDPEGRGSFSYFRR
jgi:hypothetical protein